MTLHDTLDRAADEAMSARRLDPVAILAGAEPGNRRRLGRRGPAMVMAAASVALLTVVVPLLGVPGPGADRPGGAPVVAPGLPGGWSTTSAVAPPITEQPIPVAVLAVVSNPVDGEGKAAGPSVVDLVAPGGTQYRRIPWNADLGGALALAPDGRTAAWTWTDGSGRPENMARLSLLTLATGAVTVVTLPADTTHTEVTRLGWTPRGWLVEADPHPNQPGYRVQRWLVSHGGMVSPGCEESGCAPLPGQLFNPALPMAEAFPTSLAGAPMDAVATVRSAGNAWWVRLWRGGKVVADWPVTGQTPLVDVSVLGWSPAGVLLRVESLGQPHGESVRLLDPATGVTTVLSRRVLGFARPVAVATDLVTAASAASASAAAASSVTPPAAGNGSALGSWLRSWLAPRQWTGRRLALLAVGFLVLLALAVTAIRSRAAAVSRR